jgi:hypothetical protein
MEADVMTELEIEGIKKCAGCGKWVKYCGTVQENYKVDVCNNGNSKWFCSDGCYNEYIKKYKRKCIECGVGFFAKSASIESCKSCSMKDFYRITRGYKKKLYKNTLPDIIVGTCCTILKSHHDILKDDPERLSTEFIKSLSNCKCDRI